jgi:hypothetical protein
MTCFTSASRGGKQLQDAKHESLLFLEGQSDRPKMLASNRPLEDICVKVLQLTFDVADVR